MKSYSLYLSTMTGSNIQSVFTGTITGANVITITENTEKPQFNYRVLALLMLLLLHQEHLYKHQDIKVVMLIHNSFTLGIRAWD